MSIDKVEILQNKLTDIAKSDPKRSFYSLRDKVYRMDFLERAWYEVKKNRGSSGPDGVSIPEIEEQGVEQLLLELQEELRTDIYKPGPILRVYIPKSNGGKRPLGIPNVRDRIVQASVKLLIEPIFEVDFLPMSYGFRPGKSAKDATKEIYKWLNYGHIYVLDADIEHCFDEIPHDKLLKAVSCRISDKYVLKLISMWLKSPILEDGNYRKVKKGTPQGGVISPLLANIYLDQLDKWWVQQGMTRRSGCNARMVRYADDSAPRSCIRDEGRPLGVGLQEQAPNHPELHGLRARVVSVEGKGMAMTMSDEVQGDEEHEPLRRCRKRIDGVKTGGCRYSRISPGRTCLLPGRHPA